jgi:hypothetical protein
LARRKHHARAYPSPKIFCFFPQYQNRSSAKRIAQRLFNALLKRCALKENLLRYFRHRLMAKSASIDVRSATITTRPTVSAWADGQFVGDAREEKLLNGFGSEDQAALLFRTTSLGLHEAVRAE